MARLVLGRYAFYFGIRIIVGIFIPAVFIIYAIYSKTYPTDGVSSMILIGVFFDKYLLLNLTD